MSESENVASIAFLRTLLTIGCLWLPLIWLDSSGLEIRVWTARVGYFILSIVWITAVSDRMKQAGWSQFIGYGWSVVMIALVLGMHDLLSGTDGVSRRYLSSPPLPRGTASMLSLLRRIDGYEMLALFLMISAPFAFLPIRVAASPQLGRPRRGRITTFRGKHVEPLIVGPLAFVGRVFLIGVFWLPLIYLDSPPHEEILFRWIARVGYVILGYAWLMNADGRFEDAGLGFNWEGKQYCLVVSAASLMPRAVHWVNGYEALAIFALIQIPTVLMPSKRLPEEPSPAFSNP